MYRFVLLALCLLPLTGASAAELKIGLKENARVLFLGDSITNAGMYVQYLDAYLFTRFPDRHYELINLGLPSETVSGLSEPDHPYPRPNVHERLDRALAKVKPDVVVACYGMNDGIYYPLSQDRLARYQAGIQKLIDAVKASGAKLYLLTPPPFDPLPVRDKVLPPGRSKYSWMQPYAGYNGVLASYSEWLLSQPTKDVTVLDTHTAVEGFLSSVRREDPGFFLAGDGVHMNGTGHWPMAQTLLQAWHAPAEVDRAEIDAGNKKVLQGAVTGLAVADGGVRFQWKSRLPMPSDPAWDPRLAKFQKIEERVNKHTLLVAGLPKEKYVLWEGETRLGEVTRKQLAEGLDLLQYPELTTNKRAAELFPLVVERQKLLAPAWLTDVGHKRPDTPAGLPLAEATQKAAELEKQIRTLAQPVTLELRLTPAQ